MNIWILDSDSGITLLYKPYMDMPVNEDLVSGLLTALNQFTVVEFQQPIESIDMGGLRWVYVEDKESGLLFIVADTKDLKSEILRARLNVIKQSFFQNYIKDNLDWKEKWDGNVQKFKPFEDVIDEYYSQWKQAESITTIAEFFDILGVFQQILNLLMNVIQGNIFGKAKVSIYEKLENMFETFRNHQYIKKDPELSKISFDQDTGFNVISINPTNTDLLIVEKQVINLIRAIVEIIKGEIGHVLSLNFFIEENIFDYIFNNLVLLKELNLEKFLLQLFLLK